MDVKAACKVLGISKSLLYQILKEKRIRHRRIGARHRKGKIIIDDEAIRAFEEECAAELEDD